MSRLSAVLLDLVDLLILSLTFASLDAAHNYGNDADEQK